MAVRDRTRLTGATSGAFTSSFGHNIGRTRQCTTHERCVDEIKLGDGGEFTVTRLTITGAHTGSQLKPLSGSSWFKVDNFCLTLYMNASLQANQSSHLTVSDEPTDTWLATRLVAMTNPSRADIDLPAFFGEITDLPKLVRDAGSGLLRKAANANIQVQFGILPLVKDATALLDFVDLVDKRMAELRALKKSGLRRTRTLFRGSANTMPGAQFLANSNPSQVIVYVKRAKTTNLHAWGHVKWFPTGDFPTTDRTQLALARKAVLGLNRRNPSAAVWEVIPWSWLIDWYINIGAFLNASRNTVPCIHSTPQIMRERVTEATDWISQSSDFPVAFPVGSVIRTRNESKTRRTASVSLSARLPTLSWKQLSILGSLAILKNKGGRYL